MAAPAYQAIGTLAAGVGAISVSWPTHATDDIGILCVESSAYPTTPSGWTLILQVSAAAGSFLSVYWRRATSSAMGSASINDTGDHQMGIIVTFRGALTTSDPIYSSGSNTAAASTSVAFAGVSCGGSGTIDPVRVIYVTSRANDSAAAAFTWSSGRTERYDAGSALGDGGGLGIATLDADKTTGSGGSGQADSSVSTDLCLIEFALIAPPQPRTGTAATIQAVQTISATGSLRFSGPAALTQAVQTIAATGTSGIYGTAATVQVPQAISATGSLSFSGSAATIQAIQTFAATGAVTAPPVTGSGGTIQVSQITQAIASMTIRVTYPHDGPFLRAWYGRR